MASVAQKVAGRSHTLERNELQLKQYDPDLDVPPSSDKDSSVTSSTDPGLQSPVSSSSAAASSRSTFSSVGPSTVASGGAPPSGDCGQVDDASASTSSLRATTGNAKECLSPDTEISERLEDFRLGEEKPQEEQRNIKRQVKGLHAVYLHLLDAFGELISDQFHGIQVTTDDNDTSVTIEGEQLTVEAIEKVLHTLLHKQKTSAYIKEVADKFTGWEVVFSDIEENIGRGDYFLNYREGLVDGCTAEELCICLSYSDQQGPLSFDQFLKMHVSKKELAVETEAAAGLLSTTAWDEFTQTDLEDKYGRRIEVVRDIYNDRKVWALGSVELLEDALRSAELFLQNAPDDRYIRLHPKVADFFSSCGKNVLANLQTGTGFDNAEIHIEKNTVRIVGCRAGVRRAEKRLNQIIEKFRCKRAVLSHPLLSSIVSSQMWDRMVQNVSAECSCIIASLPDPQIPDADEDCEDWGQWNATVLHSFVLSGKLKCHVVEGKGEDLKVDAVIVCCTGKSALSSQQHRPQPMLPSTQGEGARPKTCMSSGGHEPVTQTGGIYITQSGAQPCKALIRVDLTHYFSETSRDNPLEGCMEKLMADVFRECNSHHFASLAVPVIGVDEPWDCPVPVDEASKAIVRCIRHLCSDGTSTFTDHSEYDHGGSFQARRQDSNLRDVFLCSKRTACLRGLTYFLQDGDNAELPAPALYKESVKFLSSLTPKRGKTPHSGSITISRGDISKTQADALIVPLDIDIDLDLNKSKVTRSLSQHGGMSVQSTLEGGSVWGFGNRAAERNEDLAEKHVLVGSGGTLRTENIFYVFLPPWGPGVQQMLTNRVLNCLRRVCEKRSRSVAMTALGIGKLGYPPEFVARTTLAAVTHFMERKETSLQNVNIVIFPADRSSFTAFSREHTEWQKHRVFAHDDSVHQQPLVYPHHTVNTSHSSLTASSPEQSRSYATVAKGSEGRGQHRGRGRRGGGGRGRNLYHSHSSPHSHYDSTELVYSNPYTHEAGKHSSCVKIGQIKLCVKIGGITHEKCDIVVNSINDEFDFSRGGVSRAFQAQCSDYLMAICHRKDNKKKMKKKGRVITPAPGLASCDKILHLDLARFMSKPQQTIKDCLTLVIDNHPKCHSIAFPALGTGASHSNGPEQLVEHVVQAIQDVKKPKHLEEVRLIASNQELFMRMAATLNRLASSLSKQPAKSQQQKSSQPAGTMPKNMDTKYPVQTLSSAKEISSIIVKGYNSDLTGNGAVSLFIFSDSEEDRQKAVDEIASRIVSILGPAETNIFERNEAQSSERNGKDHGTECYIGGRLNPMNWNIMSHKQ